MPVATAHFRHIACSQNRRKRATGNDPARPGAVLRRMRIRLLVCDGRHCRCECRCRPLRTCLRIRNFSCRAGIIRAMRRGLSFMLVILLVLRGLLGDAMAMGMAPVTLPTAPLQHHTLMAAERGIDIHDQDHAGATEHGPVIATAAACPVDEAASAHDCGHASGPTCSACGISHSALFSQDLVAQALPPQPAVLQPLGSTRFASAPAALDIKPPIS